MERTRDALDSAPTMEIALHEIEPWLIQYQFTRYNLAESGMVNQRLGELMRELGIGLEALGEVSLANEDTRGSLALRRAIAGLYDTLSPEDVLVTTGTSEALWLYYQVRHRPGANAVVPVPAFQSLFEVPRYQGYELRAVPLRAERGFRPDLDELCGAIDGQTRVVVINNPQNPTGIVFTEAELGAVLAKARAVGAEILADEHYRFVPYGEEDLLPSLVDRGGAGVVSVGSMIKCFGCVGLRVGWLTGPKVLLDACRDLKDYTTHTVCGISDQLATWLLLHRERVMPRYRRWVTANVRAFAGFVERHAQWLEWTPPQGGLVAFPALAPGVGLSSAECARKLVEATEVFILPGETFRTPRHFRVGFGLSPEDFEAALGRWSAFLARGGWRE